jgi:tRNA pseudouridine38-40 synthase
MIARYQVILAYDGSRYHGFQRQNQAMSKVSAPTVQGVIEDALRQIGWEGSSILAAGRTDAGVHALGQVIAFDLAWKHGIQDLQAALNANLPDNVVAWHVTEADATFHPRFDAITRRYRYHIFCQELRHPHRERYAWRVWPPVDIELMRLAALQLVGTHDFAAFGAPPTGSGTTVRTVHSAVWYDIERDPSDFSLGVPELCFEIVANAFLYRMVRRVTDVLVGIGHHRVDVDAISHHLATPPSTVVRGLAPANGLFLVDATYPTG